MDLGQNVASIDDSGLKVAFSLGRETDASAYNIAKDPKERVRLPIGDFPVQLEALIKYRTYQSHIVYQYDASVRAK